MVLSKTFSGLRGRKSLLCTSLVLMGTMITVTIPLPSCHELHPFQLAPPPDARRCVCRWDLPIVS